MLEHPQHHRIVFHHQQPDVVSHRFDDYFVFPRRSSPLFPPLLRSSPISRISIPLSNPLTMSKVVRAATLTATSASISTPVSAVVVTLESIATPFSHSRTFTSTRERGRGWHIGINSAVRLAAMMPSIRDTSNRSPF